VRAIGRDPDKLAALKAQGAEPVTAAFDDSARLAQAFAGCQGAFVMIPPDYSEEDPGAYQDRVGEAIKAALQRSGIGRAVSLSSLGAQQAQGTGPVKGLHRQERRLGELAGVSLVHLRPGYFMENLYAYIPVIRERGLIASAIRADLPLWMVAAEDIGRKAADLLEGLSFTGKTACEFVGPGQLSLPEAARALGSALGLPELQYAQLSYEDLEASLLGSGLRPGIVRLLSEMQRGFNEGRFAPAHPIGPGQRGSTTFASFARRFAEAFAAQSAAAA